MPIQATNVADVLINSLNELDRLKFTDMSSDYQNTIALKRIFKKKKTTFDSGPEIQFNIMTDTSDSARHVGLAYVSQVDIKNLLAVGKMPWRHTTWNWAMERRLVQMNSGKAKILDIAQMQRLAAFGGAILLFERTLWRCPTAAEFDVHPVGIPYFVVKSSTAANDTTGGFNGSLPSGYTVIANVDPTATATLRWKNYADTYSALTKDDLIYKMCRAQMFTDFMPLVDDMPVHAVGHDYGIYTNFKVCLNLRTILETQNDDLGTDVASMEGRAVFMRSPFVPVKQLNADTTDPIYMLDWNEIGAMGLSNEWMHEQHFQAEANQPTVSMTNTDCSWNLMCRNRRKQAVLATSTTMPDGAAAA